MVVVGVVVAVVVACVVAVAGDYEGLRLVEGGYEGLVVAITDHVPQQHCNQVILGIKTVEQDRQRTVTSGSTHQRTVTRRSTVTSTDMRPFVNSNNVMAGGDESIWHTKREEDEEEEEKEEEEEEEEEEEGEGEEEEEERGAWEGMEDEERGA
ncbi:hypothetical protein Pcinc_042361 [Petrolisthes cinctipes]|uniref:Uncharacterized protein n=1 Tax=Petrolisthes cinctipes TaxID=88211 RepID=A0AAE1BK45_PETCI|nr:hypothetical protein Pcinc_042361 [Petrolisthes cinctipes]